MRLQKYSQIIPPLIKERRLVEEVNTVVFYLTLLGCFYAVAKYVHATITFEVGVKVVKIRRSIAFHDL